MVSQGYRPSLISACGNDTFGRKLQNELLKIEKDGEIRLHAVNSPTCMSTNIVSSISGESVYFISGEACKHLTIELLKLDCTILILCAYAKMDGLHKELPQYLSSLAIKPRVFLDPGRIDSTSHKVITAITELLPFTEMLKLNSGELLSLFKTSDLDLAVEKCRAAYKDLDLVVTLGSDGCLVVPASDKRQQKLAPSGNVKQGISKAGAGDAFFAQLIHEYLEKGDLIVSAKKAMMFAEKYLRTKGARISGY